MLESNVIEVHVVLPHIFPVVLQIDDDWQNAIEHNAKADDIDDVGKVENVFLFIDGLNVLELVDTEDVQHQ